MNLKPYTRCEFAIWLSGAETEEQMNHFKTVVIPGMLEKSEKESNVKIANPEFFIKRPGEDRVPEVPEHIHGIDVRLLVVEADVFPAPKLMEVKGITNDLDEKSLQTLRRVTRRAHQKNHPGMPSLNNGQCDAIINALGPDVITKMLRDGSSLH